MTVIDFFRPFGRLRFFLGKTGLLPRFMKRSNTDRRVLKDRRIRSSNEYLITEGADRRFQPDRRSHTERRAGSLTMDDLMNT
jgi:hypothetical protein